MNKQHPIRGVWYVEIVGAPFKHHVFSFHSDGTMQQANPDAGDPVTSDSIGLGEWIAEGNRIQGKFVEITANRKTHKFVSRGEISFVLHVQGDTFSGSAEARFYDQAGILKKGPLPATLSGSRITLNVS
jgi:hypothetical protein